MKAGFYTLGCKLNQCETEALADAFRRAGFAAVGIDEEADIYLINTCTVTSKSEQKARRIVRKLRGERPEVPIIVTGCYAEMEENEVARLGGSVFAVGMEAKADLLSLPEYLASEAPYSPGFSLLKPLQLWVGRGRSGERPDTESVHHGAFAFDASKFSFHTRGFLKIQDGCDNRCAYCRVRIARGRSISLSREEVLIRYNRLVSRGLEEIVLTGVNLSSYRWNETGLTELLFEILAGRAAARIRLSSLEPDAVGPGLASVLRDPGICPHFHLPIQSGSNAVLASMGRHYLVKDVERAVDLLRAAKEDPYIAGDVIVGFPGETDEDHRRTRDFLLSLDISDLHVFPFSPRPGTPAYSMVPKVPERTAGERAAELRAIAAEGKRRYLERYVGRNLDVLAEEFDPLSNTWKGLSENYLTVRIEGGMGNRSGEILRGRRYTIATQDIRDNILIGLFS
jgi:threonylcarbamoyladenosine tRNA methylthiotransferase MtaB